MFYNSFIRKKLNKTVDTKNLRSIKNVHDVVENVYKPNIFNLQTIDK